MKIKEIASGAKVGVGIAEFRAKLLKVGVERRSKKLESDAEAVVQSLEHRNRQGHLLRCTIRTKKCLISDEEEEE